MKRLRSSVTVVTGLTLLGILTAAAACGNNSESDLAPATLTDTITGTVEMGSEDFHNFTVTKNGTVTVTLTAAGPPPTITVGLGVGIPDSTGCPVAPNATVAAFASTSPQLAGTLPAATYCVDVFDLGNQSGPITYTLTVVHP